MSRAFVRESEVEAPDELPDRLISPYPNDVTPEGLKQLELMLEMGGKPMLLPSKGRIDQHWL